MRTYLRDDVTPLENDKKVIAMLKFAAPKTSDERSIYRVGVRNKDGCVYRIVEAHDLDEACRLVKALANLGFTEEDAPEAEDFTSTFSDLSA